MAELKRQGILAVFHYIPLDTAAAGVAYGKRSEVPLEITYSISERLLRLPLFFDFKEIESVLHFLVQFLSGKERS